MAKSKNKRKPPSKRAKERAALQKKFANMSFTKMSELVQRGKVTIADIRKYYTDARSKAVKRVQRVMASDVPFIDAPPDFKKTSELSDADLLKEVSDVNKFLRGHTYGATTVEERKKLRDKALVTLQKRGYNFLNKRNFNEWARFQKWMKTIGISAEYDSESPSIVQIFKQAEAENRQEPSRWAELYHEYREFRAKRKGKKR